MDGGVQHFRVIGKFAIQHAQKVFGCVELIFHHGATDARQARAAPEILIAGLRDCLLQQRNRFGATALAWRDRERAGQMMQALVPVEELSSGRLSRMKGGRQDQQRAKPLETWQLGIKEKGQAL